MKKGSVCIYTCITEMRMSFQVQLPNQRQSNHPNDICDTVYINFMSNYK